jgi:TonB family protein
LVKNTKYPIEDAKNGTTGKVVISYYVNEIGKVEDINITNSVSPGIDAEAIRLIKQLPIESPNFVDDIPMRVKYWTPIIFDQ